MNKTVVAKEVADLIIGQFNEVILKALKEFAKDYDIQGVTDKEYEKYFISPVSVIPSSKEKLRITKIKAIKPAASEQRCEARVWNNQHGGQCIRSKTKDSNLCTQHGEYFKTKGTLKHGFIHEPKPLIFRPASTRKAIL
jgi:hypothetical protein